MHSEILEIFSGCGQGQVSSCS